MAKSLTFSVLPGSGKEGQELSAEVLFVWLSFFLRRYLNPGLLLLCPHKLLLT